MAVVVIRCVLFSVHPVVAITTMEVEKAQKTNYPSRHRNMGSFQMEILAANEKKN